MPRTLPGENGLSLSNLRKGITILRGDCVHFQGGEAIICQKNKCSSQILKDMSLPSNNLYFATVNFFLLARLLIFFCSLYFFFGNITCRSIKMSTLNIFPPHAYISFKASDLESNPKVKCKSNVSYNSKGGLFLAASSMNE